MKTIYINDFKTGDNVTDFFMLNNLTRKVGSTGKPYLDMTLTDKSGKIAGKKWDVSKDDELLLSNVENGIIVKVSGSVTSFNEQPQFRIGQIRRAMGDELTRLGIDVDDFVRRAPEKSGEMFKYLCSVAEAMKDEDFKMVALKALIDNKERIISHPAAISNHHSLYGGLLYHMKRMVEHALVLCDIYKILNRDLLVTGTILHDIEKLNEIEANKMGIGTGYSMEGKMLGHLVMGAKTVSRWCEELRVGDEKSLMLQHMMLSHHGKLEFGSPVRPIFPEAMMLHYIDAMDANMYDMEEALNQVASGGYTEPIRTMDNRRLYKPTWANDSNE